MRQQFKWIHGVFAVFFLILAALAVPVPAEASSCVIQFTSASTQVKRGDIFTIVCQVSSGDPFLDVSFTIDYDDSIMQFVKGGKKVSGGYGELLVESLGNSVETNKKTFSLQFMAKGNGSGLISVKDTAEVTDAAGSSFSISSNRLSIRVTKKGTEDSAVPGTDSGEVPPDAVVTPSPVLSGENRLKSLKTSAVSMTPAFAPEITEYRAVVDCDTETLYFSLLPEDDKARVKISGNDKLKQGDNQVKIKVTAENGKGNVYKIVVNRETVEETEERESAGKEEDKDITFEVLRAGDSIFLQNSYQFEVLDADGLKIVPEGYIETQIVLDGVSVPAFTMEEDLDSNFLLLYLKGPSGENGLYQYDREEKTLQRYTGSMVERVNHGTGGGSFFEWNVPGYVMLGIIVLLVIVILCLLITMLKMAIQRKEPEAEQSLKL